MHERIHERSNIIFLDVQPTYVIKGLGFPEDAYTSWIQKGLNVAPEDIRRIDAINSDLPQLETTDILIIAGSHHSVNEGLVWQKQVEEGLQYAAENDIAVLGLCYGLQAVAKSQGARVIDDPKGSETGITTVTLTETGVLHPLFRDMPASFTIFTAHSLSVEEASLPVHSTILVRNTEHPVQAVAFGKKILGLQFHPELPKEAMQAIEEKREQSFLSETNNTTTLHKNTVVVDFKKREEAERTGKHILKNYMRYIVKN